MALALDYQPMWCRLRVRLHIDRHDFYTMVSTAAIFDAGCFTTFILSRSFIARPRDALEEIFASVAQLHRRVEAAHLDSSTACRARRIWALRVLRWHRHFRWPDGGREFIGAGLVAASTCLFNICAYRWRISSASDDYLCPRYIAQI